MKTKDGKELTYDVQFDGADSKGWHETKKYCINYVKMYNGTNESYFEDYKGCMVQVVCNETGEVVYEEVIR